MNYRDLFLTIITISVLLTGCVKNNVDPIEEITPTPEPFVFDSLSVEEIKELIAGEWEWIYSIVARPYAYVTPDSVGYTIQMNFDADSVLQYYKDNQLEATFYYKIYKHKIHPDYPEFATIIESGLSTSLLKFSHPDSMKFDQSAHDIGTDFFVRKK
ncbi:MAG: hypothetical protein IPM56_11145 [Ignavibacteriales bacterium]|nr:MAG: hypothetical protein IPM56_11145 [Ignavibacteriales bacterium]